MALVSSTTLMAYDPCLSTITQIDIHQNDPIEANTEDRRRRLRASLKRFLLIARLSFRRLYARPGQVVRCPRLIAMNLNRGSAADLSQ
jgi:hypothetical protein